MLDRVRECSYNVVKPFLTNRFLIVPLLWHCLQVSFLILNLRYAISPDEDHHLRVVELYSRCDGLRVSDTIESLKYGALSVYPYLYHRILGSLYVFVSKPDIQLLFLRVCSFLMSIGTFVALAHISQKLTRDKLVQALCLILLANTPKFQLLSAAVSYDNAINFLSAVLLLQCVRYWSSPTLKRLLWIICTFLFGSLIKITFLPWIVVLLPLIGMSVWKKNIFQLSHKPSLYAVPVFVLCLLLILFVDLFGGNLLSYGTVEPSASQVVGYERAYSHYPIFQRNAFLAAESAEKKLMPWYRWLSLYFERALQGIFGIQGYKNFGRSPTHLLLYELGVLFFLFSLLLSVRRRKLLEGAEREDGLLLLLFSLVYAGFVLQNNYSLYLKYRAFGFALQGRYLFPALIAFLPVYSLVCLRPWGARARRFIFLVLGVVSTGLGWPYIVRQPVMWRSILASGAVWDKELNADHAYFKPPDRLETILSQDQRVDGLALTEDVWLAQQLILEDPVKIDVLELFLIEGQSYTLVVAENQNGLPGATIFSRDLMPETSGFVALTLQAALQSGAQWLIIKGGSPNISDVGTSAEGQDRYSGRLLRTHDRGETWEELNRDLYFKLQKKAAD